MTQGKSQEFFEINFKSLLKKVFGTIEKKDSSFVKSATTGRPAQKSPLGGCAELAVSGTLFYGDRRRLNVR